MKKRKDEIKIISFDIEKVTHEISDTRSEMDVLIHKHAILKRKLKPLGHKLATLMEKSIRREQETNPKASHCSLLLRKTKEIVHGKEKKRKKIASAGKEILAEKKKPIFKTIDQYFISSSTKKSIENGEKKEQKINKLKINKGIKAEDKLQQRRKKEENKGEKEGECSEEIDLDDLNQEFFIMTDDIFQKIQNKCQTFLQIQDPTPDEKLSLYTLQEITLDQKRKGTLQALIDLKEQEANKQLSLEGQERMKILNKQRDENDKEWLEFMEMKWKFISELEEEEPTEIINECFTNDSQTKPLTNFLSPVHHPQVKKRKKGS